MRILFMGTPEFAVATLEKLISSEHEIVAVVTAPDKLQGRGMQTLQASAVKQFALQHNLLVLQPEKLRDPQFIATLHQFQPDIGIVVAFRMLPEMVWSLPRLGTFNLHGSLLPRYRGAAPIHWAVINGETETGVTTFKLKSEIDTGDILLQAHTPIAPHETTGEVYERLMHIGAQLVLDTLDLLNTEQFQLQMQDDSKACPAPKLHNENTQLNLQKTAAETHNFIRGLQPYPGAWARWRGKQLKLIASQKVDFPTDLQTNGTLFASSDRKHLLLQCVDGPIELTQLQPEGKKRLSGVDFLNGYLIQGAEMLES